MTLRAKNGRWEYRFQLPGEVRVTKLTDLEATDANRAKAERLEQAHRDAILKGQKQAKRQRQIGFSDAADLFMQTVSMDHLASTARRVETSLASLRLHFGVRPLASIRPVDVENYKAWRLNEHQVQPITLRHDLDNLSKMFKWAKRMDLCTGNPTDAITKPSGEAERVYVVSWDEEMAYFSAAVKYPNLHDVARLMLLQGMRPEEVLSLRKDAVNLEAGTLTVIQGKTKAARRTLRLRAESRSILAARMGTEGPWVFPSPRTEDHLVKLNGIHDKIIEQVYGNPSLPRTGAGSGAGAMAGGTIAPVAGVGRTATSDREVTTRKGASTARGGHIEGLPAEPLGFNLYALRHTFATRAAAAGMDLTALAAILGHSGLRCVMKYVHVQQGHMNAQMAQLDAPVVEKRTEGRA